VDILTAAGTLPEHGGHGRGSKTYGTIDVFARVLFGGQRAIQAVDVFRRLDKVGGTCTQTPIVHCIQFVHARLFAADIAIVFEHITTILFVHEPLAFHDQYVCEQLVLFARRIAHDGNVVRVLVDVAKHDSKLPAGIPKHDALAVVTNPRQDMPVMLS
jgi:hypothetical protein